MEILSIILGLVVIFLSVLVYYALKRISQYEALLSQLAETIDYIKEQGEDDLYFPPIEE